MMCAWMAIGRHWRQYVRLGLWGSNRQRKESWYICLAAWSNLREGNMPLLKRWGLSSGGGDQTEASSKILDRPRCSLQPVSKRSISFKSHIFREVLKKGLSAWHIIYSLAYNSGEEISLAWSLNNYRTLTPNNRKIIFWKSFDISEFQFGNI